VPVESVREFYHWLPAEKPFSVQVNFDAIDRIHVEVMRGFGAVRRRGAEVGGLLLGTIIPGHEPIVTIYDFEAVPCEYAMGPSYLLSENDLQKFQQLLDYWSPSAGRDMYAVGFFRSHTREGLEAAPEDLKLFEEHFSDPASVLLLVKPFASKSSIGGFLFREDGEIRSTTPYLEFPFRSRDLGAKTSGLPPALQRQPDFHSEPQIAQNTIEQTTPVPANHHRHDPEPPPRSVAPDHRETNPIPTVVARPDRGPMFADFHPTPSRWRSKAGWILFSVALIVFGSVVGYQYADGKSGSVSSAADPYALNLTATRADENVVVKWDRTSLAVRNGWRGLLTITEGEDSKIVQMDVPQLQNGSVLYRHLAPEIRFKLEVFLKEQRSVVETLTFRLQ
jgi:hypothetical protein